MIKKKIFICIIFSFIGFLPVFSLDFGFTSHFLDFSSAQNEPSFALSFDITEEIASGIEIGAKILQSSKHNYTAFSTADFAFSFFHLGGGIMYDIRDALISPGFIVDARAKFKKESFLGLSYYASFSPENLVENISQNGKIYLSSKNTNASLEAFADITYVQIQEVKHNLVLTSKTEIMGFDEKSFIALGLLFSSELFINTNNVLELDLLFRLGGKITLNFKKWGSYFFTYESNLFRLSEKIQSTPSFNIHCGARFRIDN